MELNGNVGEMCQKKSPFPDAFFDVSVSTDFFFAFLYLHKRPGKESQNHMQDIPASVKSHI